MYLNVADSDFSPLSLLIKLPLKINSHFYFRIYFSTRFHSLCPNHDVLFSPRGQATKARTLEAPLRSGISEAEVAV